MSSLHPVTASNTSIQNGSFTLKSMQKSLLRLVTANTLSRFHLQLKPEQAVVLKGIRI